MATRIALLLISLFSPSLAWASNCDGAGNCYVRAGASGSRNGSSWTNACNDFTGACSPSNMTRGVTYWLGSGTYTGQTFNTPTNGTQVITIRVATASNHGPAGDWASGFVGLATMQDPNVTTGYWTFDGQTRGADWKSGYNLRFSCQNANSNNFDINQGSNGGKNITIQYAEFPGCGDASFDCFANGGCGVNINVAQRADNFRLAYCYLHDPPDGMVQGSPNDLGIAANWTIEYNYFLNNHVNASGGAQHSAAIVAITSTLIIRYNKFKNIQSTAFIDAAFGAPSIPLGSWFIYGNIFWWDNSYAEFVSAIVHVNSGVTSWTGPIFVYNNTVANIKNVAQPRADLWSANNLGWTAIVENNLYWNCSTTNGYGQQSSDTPGMTLDYNTYYDTPSPEDMGIHKKVHTGNPFVNFASEDFHLTARMTGPDSGITLPAPYNIDLDGHARVSGAWARGAFEFNNSPRPNPPSNLRIVSVN